MPQGAQLGGGGLLQRLRDTHRRPRLRQPRSTVERCPNCGSPPGSATACVECGYLLGTPDVVAPWEEQNWEILVRPDRVFYESQEPDGMDFPEQTSTRRFLLTGDHVRIGRHSSTRGIEAEIDLSGALEDTGVSHRHAVLMRQPEGNWALVDQDSTNGTFLNADAEPVLANHPDRSLRR